MRFSKKGAPPGFREVHHAVVRRQQRYHLLLGFVFRIHFKQKKKKRKRKKTLCKGERLANKLFQRN